MPHRRLLKPKPPPKRDSGASLWILAIVLSVVAFVIVFRHVAEHAAPSSFVVTGYVPEYRLEHVRAHLGVLAQSVTELILFSVQPTRDGNVTFDVGLSQLQVGAMVAAAHAHGIPRVLLCVGGGGRSAGFAAATQTKATRAVLVTTLLTLCVRHGLAGVDLDWEAPAHRDEVNNYAALLLEMKPVFSQRSLLVTVALHPWQNLGAAAMHAVDRVHVMAYDMPGQHSTLADAKRVIRDMTQAGAPVARLALGIPAYGRGVAAPQDARTYADISRAPGFRVQADTTVDGVYYNGPPTVSAKTSWARLHGLAGVVFWELGQDSFDPALSLAAAAAAATSTLES